MKKYHSNQMGTIVNCKKAFGVAGGLALFDDLELSHHPRWTEPTTN
jgi:hypothetical protein